MMATKNPNALGQALVKALGLDSDRVYSITVTCETGKVDLAEVTYYVVDADTSEVATEVRCYELRDVT